MCITVLLPMKEHSDRVPNKNMKDFNGMPLYHAIMKVLLHSKHVGKIAINTDSEIIAEDAVNYFEKVVIINRPEKIRGDFISMNDIIAYDLSQMEGEHFLQTHSTNPLLTTKTLDKAIKSYFDHLETHDSLFSVTQFQSRFYCEDGRAINHDPKELLRTQDLPPLFEENSNFYIFSKNSFSKAGNRRIGLKPKMFEVNKIEAIDIDNPEDFELAELLYKKRLS